MTNPTNQTATALARQIHQAARAAGLDAVRFADVVHVRTPGTRLQTLRTLEDLTELLAWRGLA